MIKTLLIIISFATITISVRSIVNEKKKSNFDEILNYKLEEESIEELNYAVDISTNKEEGIKQLINEGYEDDEICKELNIGRGELLLIKKCYKM